MDKRFIKAVLILLFTILIGIGTYFIYQILSPEIAYQIEVKPNIINVEKQKETKVEGNRLIIPSIGFNSEIDTDYSSLDGGGWVHELGVDGKPSLIAVHRFGVNNLSPQDKVKTTLYHVYKLKPGDMVLVWWEGKEYVYKVQEVFESTQKPEIHEDELYIYTCLFWDDEERVFVKLT